MTNSPVFPGHVLFSRPVLAVFYKLMKMSWFSKNCLERQKYRWANKEDEEEKQDKEEEN